MKLSYILIPIVILCVQTYSQQSGDSVLYVPISDSLKADTNASKSDINAIIEYSASDSAIFDVSQDKLFLYNEAELKYKEYDLKAARVILYRESSIMEAYGIPDTSKAGKFIGQPIFMEGAKRYDASKLRYNFSTRQGTIDMGSTAIEGGYYVGEKIKKVDENNYFIKNGQYTTCSKANPDYYFGSPKLKVIQGDEVIAEPVYLYIDEVPVFALPFGIFPNHAGRSSGLLPFTYGEDPTYGRYLAHLGYFYVINDFTDISLQGNYYTNGRIDLSSRFRYVVRYKLSGSVDIGGSRIRLGESNDLDRQFTDEWRIGVFHSQTINPTTSLNANVNFLSSINYYNTASNNLEDLLLQNALSNVTLTKFWEGTPNSLTMFYSRDQNLSNGEVLQTIPALTFVRSQTFPFRGKNTSMLDLNWYEMLSYTYNAQLQYKDDKLLVNRSLNNGNFIKNSRGGLRQGLNFSAPIKFSEVSLSPFFNYNEVWYNKSIIKSFNPADSTVSTTDVTGFKAFRYFNSGISLNTRLIGLFNTNFLGVKGFRHVLTPALSYTFQPDFSKSVWNAYGSYINQFGQEVKYSFFDSEIFGGAPRGEQQLLSFSLENVFEMKVKATDTTVNKFQLLNLNGGIAYNFASDSLNFSELGLNYRTQIGSLLNIAGGASFNLYKYVNGTGRINKFLWNEENRLAQLTFFNLALSSTFQGGQIETGEPEDSSLVEQDLSETLTEESDYVGVYGDRPFDFSIPWSLTLNYNYSINKSNPALISKFSIISGSLNFNMTKNLRFTFSAGYDIFRRQVSTPYITVYRDLHCWEMSFNWVPTGIYRGYKFEIRIKAPQLQDVKVTKQTNYRGVF